MKMHKKNKSERVITDALSCMPLNDNELSILQERSTQIAKIEIKRIQEKDTFHYIHFKLGDDEQYGIPYQVTKEVIHNMPITYVPSTFDFIAGVINRRGILINVIDLKKFFNLTKSTTSTNPNIIIVQYKSIQVGFSVDAIQGSGFCSREKLDAPIPSNNAIKPGYIMGLFHGEIAIINMEAIILELEARLKI